MFKVDLRHTQHLSQVAAVSIVPAKKFHLVYSLTVVLWAAIMLYFEFCHV